MHDNRNQHTAEDKSRPQHQTDATNGTVKQLQLDRHSAAQTKRGSEGDRRRASNTQR